MASVGCPLLPVALAASLLAAGLHVSLWRGLEDSVHHVISTCLHQNRLDYDSHCLGHLWHQDAAFRDAAAECKHEAGHDGQQLCAANRNCKGRRNQKMIEDALESVSDRCPIVKTVHDVLHFPPTKPAEEPAARWPQCPRREVTDFFFWRSQVYQENRWQFQPYCAVLVLNIFR
jgi:hypothetical protein